MYRGYVKLWRKCKSDAMIKDHKLWTSWTYILMSAAHKKTRISVNNYITYIDKGEFAFTSEGLAKDLSMTRQQIRTCLKKLVDFGCIVIKTTNKMSIISVINWNNYQEEKRIKQQSSNQPTANGQPACINIQEDKSMVEEPPLGFNQEDIPQHLVGMIKWLNKNEVFDK